MIGYNILYVWMCNIYIYIYVYIYTHLCIYYLRALPHPPGDVRPCCILGGLTTISPTIISQRPLDFQRNKHIEFYRSGNILLERIKTLTSWVGRKVGGARTPVSFNQFLSWKSARMQWESKRACLSATSLSAWSPSEDRCLKTTTSQETRGAITSKRM